MAEKTKFITQLRESKNLIEQLEQDKVSNIKFLKCHDFLVMSILVIKMKIYIIIITIIETIFLFFILSDLFWVSIDLAIFVHISFSNFSFLSLAFCFFRFYLCNKC